MKLGLAGSGGTTRNDPANIKVLLDEKETEEVAHRGQGARLLKHLICGVIFNQEGTV